MRIQVIGIDISKDWFDADMLGQTLKEQFKNNQAGFRLFHQKMKKQKNCKFRICMEATGMYWEALAAFLNAKGHEVVVVNPLRIKEFTKSKLKRAKTDKSDAQSIAEFCEQNLDLPLWTPQPARHQEIKALLRRREQLVQHRVANENRSAAGYKSKIVLSSIEDERKWLSDEIKKIEKLVKSLVAADAEFQSLVELVTTIPGIGWLTAVTLLVEIPKPMWEGRIAAAYAGLVPFINESGKSVGRSHLSRVGSARVRGAVHMSALTASRRNEPLKLFYERLIKNGKKPKQALAAVARKLIHQFFAIIRSGCQFQANHRPSRLAAA